MPTLVEQVETEISDSATHTKGVSPGKIQPVAVAVSCEEGTVVPVLWDSRVHLSSCEHTGPSKGHL